MIANIIQPELNFDRTYLIYIHIIFFFLSIIVGNFSSSLVFEIQFYRPQRILLRHWMFENQLLYRLSTKAYLDLIPTDPVDRF
jgi:hypothetical protein